MPTKTFKELTAWQKSRDLAVLVYALTAQLPAEERFGLASQMRRAAISISSNIAEGYHKFSDRERRQFLSIAYGSAAELESQIEVSKLLFPHLDYAESEALLDEVLRMLNVMLQKENAK